MKKTLLTLLCVLAAALPALADTYSWTYASSKPTVSPSGNQKSSTVTAGAVKWSFSASQAININANGTVIQMASAKVADGIEVSFKNTSDFANKKITSFSITTKATKDKTVPANLYLGGANEYSFTTVSNSNNVFSPDLGEGVVTDESGISINFTTVAEAYLGIQAISITYEDAPQGPVDPSWTISDFSTITYGSPFKPSVDKAPADLPISFSIVALGEDLEPIAGSEQTPGEDGSYILNAGDYQVTASSPEVADKYNAKTESAYLTVSKATPALKWSVADFIATIGSENTFPTLSGVPDGVEVLYISNNDKVATINETTGEVTLVAPGTTTISAAIDASANYTEGEAAYNIEVRSADFIDEITFTPATVDGTLTLKVGDTLRFNCPTPGVTWNYLVSADCFDGAMGEEAEYTFTKAGTYEMTVEASKGETTKSVELIVEVEKYKPTLTFQYPSFTCEQGDQFPGNILTISGNCPDHQPAVTYSIVNDNEEIATVDPATGEVTLTGKLGYAIVSVTSTEDDWNASASTDYEITVNEPAKEAMFDFSKDPSYGLEATNSGAYWETKTTNATENGVGMTIARVGTNTANTYRLWKNTFGTDLRIYRNGTLTFTAPEGKVITKVVFGESSLSDSFAITQDGKAVDKDTREFVCGDNVTEVVFKATGASAMQNITVYFDKPLAKLGAIVADAMEMAWNKEVAYEDSPLCDVDAAPYVKATVAPKEGVTFRTPNSKELEGFKRDLGDEWMDHVIKKDSWFYTTEEGFTENATAQARLDEGGNLVVSVPCSGLYTVTLQIPEGNPFYRVETRTFDIAIVPDHSTLKINWSSPFTTDGIPTFYLHEQDYAESQGYTNHVGNANIDIDGFLHTWSVKGDNAKAATPSAIRRAIAGDYTPFSGNVDLSNHSRVQFLIEKNGTSAETDEHAIATHRDTDLPVGIEGIDQDETEIETEYFTLDGIRVAADRLTPGIYIVRKGTATAKIAVK